MIIDDDRIIAHDDLVSGFKVWQVRLVPYKGNISITPPPTTTLSPNENFMSDADVYLY